MIAGLRDHLRTLSLGVAADAINIDGDTKGVSLPRITLLTVSDPRATDLSGPSSVRTRRVQIDVYAIKGQSAESIADDVEDAVELMDGGSTTLGEWSVHGAEIVDRRSSREEPQSGQPEAINRVILDAVFAASRN